MKNLLKIIAFLAIIILFVIKIEPSLFKMPSERALRSESLAQLKQAWFHLEEINWTGDSVHVDTDLLRLRNSILKTDTLTGEPFIILPSIKDIMKMPPEERKEVPIIVSKRSEKAKGHTTLYGDGTVRFVDE